VDLDLDLDLDLDVVVDLVVVVVVVLDARSPRATLAPPVCVHERDYVSD
jgi:hypothetical protein